MVIIYTENGRSKFGSVRLFAIAHFKPNETHKSLQKKFSKIYRMKKKFVQHKYVMHELWSSHSPWKDFVTQNKTGVSAILLELLKSWMKKHKFRILYVSGTGVSAKNKLFPILKFFRLFLYFVFQKWFESINDCIATLSKMYVWHE